MTKLIKYVIITLIKAESHSSKGELKMKNYAGQIIFLTILFLAITFNIYAVQFYTIIELNAPCNYPHPLEAAISNSGLVTGEWCIGGTSRSYIWENGVSTDLGTLAEGAFFAKAVNSKGQVTGSSMNESRASRAVLWEEGVIINLGTLNGYSSKGLSINEDGIIVGCSYNQNDDIRPFIWKNGNMQDIGTLGGKSGIARGINDLNQVVGNADTVSGQSHAFLWENGVMYDLGTFGGTSSKALGINNQTRIIGGLVDNTGLWRSWIWENGSIQYIPTLGGDWGTPKDINNLGQVVGGSITSEGDWHAFLYENGISYDLNNLIPSNFGWVLDTATGINDSGWIVGYGNFKGMTKAFLLKPVPEPTLFSLAYLCSILLIFSRRLML